MRLQFPNGCVANLTASRVSTERVRKLRLFQPQPVPFAGLRAAGLAVFSVGAGRQIGFEQAPVAKAEPLKLQFDAFLDCGGDAKFAENVPAARRVKHWRWRWRFLIKLRSTRKWSRGPW